MSGSSRNHNIRIQSDLAGEVPQGPFLFHEEVEKAMMSEEQLDQFRQAGTKVRIVRDALEMNDVVGIVVAWNEKNVLIRRDNRRVVEVSRRYPIQQADEPRAEPIG